MRMLEEEMESCIIVNDLEKNKGWEIWVNLVLTANTAITIAYAYY
jgi:hypothetical protein